MKGNNQKPAPAGGRQSPRAPGPNDRRPAAGDRDIWPTAALLGVALLLRLLAWHTIPYRDFISDEAEYWSAAVWLAQGRGFAFFDQWIWTRPPAYLLFLASHIRLFGPTALWAPRLTQALLSTATVYLVVLLGRHLAPAGAERRVGWLAGWAMALSYSFAIFAYVLLSETFFLLFFLAGVLALLRWADAPERSWRLLIGAGVLFGACALIKAVVLTWLPLVALWLLLVVRRGAGRWTVRALIPAAALTAVVCTVVLPWSFYATGRWGGGAGLILVDTTGGYNFALGAQSGLPEGRNEKALHKLLCDPVCDREHALRQGRAYAQGWKWIRAEPAGFVRKMGRELLDMVQLRSGGAERFQSGYTAGMVPLPHILGLLLDDTLYVMAVLLATLGLLRSQGKTGKGLVVSWILYNVLVGALVFAINRFRQPLLPFVFVYAACGVVQLRQIWVSQRRRSAAYALAAAIALLVLPSYLYWPPALDPNRRSVIKDAWLSVRGLERAASCAEIERVLREGDVARARQLHDAADAEAGDLDCLALIYARILQREGKIDGPDGALAFLRTAVDPNNALQSARITMLEGDMLRSLGREDDNGAFFSRSVEDINDTAWAWEHLEPPPAAMIDLGAGQDYGYILNFYKREGAAEQPDNRRWSSARSLLRFPAAGTGQPQRLTLRLHGFTTNPHPTRLTVGAGDTMLPPVTLENRWQELRFDLPPVAAGADVVVTLLSDVCVLGPIDLARRVETTTGQTLPLAGFQLDWARLE